MNGTDVDAKQPDCASLLRKEFPSATRRAAARSGSTGLVLAPKGALQVPTYRNRKKHVPSFASVSVTSFCIFVSYCTPLASASMVSLVTKYLRFAALSSKIRGPKRQS